MHSVRAIEKMTDQEETMKIQFKDHKILTEWTTLNEKYKEEAETTFLNRVDSYLLKGYVIIRSFDKPMWDGMWHLRELALPVLPIVQTVEKTEDMKVQRKDHEILTGWFALNKGYNEAETTFFKQVESYLSQGYIISKTLDIPMKVGNTDGIWHMREIRLPIVEK